MAPKPYKFIGFGGLHGPKPYKFIGFGEIHGAKPYKFIGFGGLHGHKPYKCFGFGDLQGAGLLVFICFYMAFLCLALQRRLEEVRGG
jgi:hypothetical protein